MFPLFFCMAFRALFLFLARACVFRAHTAGVAVLMSTVITHTNNNTTAVFREDYPSGYGLVKNSKYAVCTYTQKRHVLGSAIVIICSISTLPGCTNTAPKDGHQHQSRVPNCSCTKSRLEGKPPAKYCLKKEGIVTAVLGRRTS